MAVVPSDLAQECMRNFDTVMEGSDIGAIKDAFSRSVTFQTSEFASWLRDNNYLEETTNIRLSFGIYTKNAAERLGVPHLAGRLTAFVWPINAAEENPPFNSGELNP